MENKTCLVKVDSEIIEVQLETREKVLIPKQTPFYLTAEVEGINQGLIYQWDQMDVSTSTDLPSSTLAFGPLFRSYEPKALPTRHFPERNTLLSKEGSPWEVLPGVARNLFFQLNVRSKDEDIYGSTTAHTLVRVADAGPFEIINDHLFSSLKGGAYFELNWETNGTQLPPINTQTVSVFLSLDGGNTFPLEMASEIPNNGKAILQMPNISSDQVRLKIEANNQPYYTISKQDATLSEMPFTVEIFETQKYLCGASQATYRLKIEKNTGVGAVDYRVTGLPDLFETNVDFTDEENLTLFVEPEFLHPASYKFDLELFSGDEVLPIALTLIVQDEEKILPEIVFLKTIKKTFNFLFNLLGPMRNLSKYNFSWQLPQILTKCFTMFL